MYFKLLALAAVALVLAVPSMGADVDRITVSETFLIDSSVADMQWLSPPKVVATEPRVVLVRSRKGSVYRSADDGRTWVSLVDSLTADGTSLDQASIANIFVGVSGDMVVLRGFGKFTWYSRDKGANFEKRDSGVWTDMQLHPTNPQWIIATSYEGNYPSRELTLYLSQDFGSTWKQLTSRIRRCEWGDAGMHGVPQETIYCTIHDAMEKTDYFKEWDINLHLYKSTDFFLTQEKIVPHGNRFSFHEFDKRRKYMFVAAMNPEDQTEIVLRVSTNSGESFTTAQLPMQLTQQSYTLLNTKEGAVFLQIQRDGEPSSYADVYVSGPGGARFAVTLKRVARDFAGTADFEMVQGVEGVYIANVVDEGYTPQQGDTSVPKKTMITFDKGGLWSGLAAPMRDSDGEDPLAKCKDCSLHLNGRSNWKYGPMYSAAASTGLVIATGNVGHHVHTREDEVNTYMSRDSGHTWQEIIKGSHIYEVGDHGGLIVLADNLKKTKRVLFSYNEGLNWTHAVFWKHHVEVENVITDPSGTSQVFILYGRNDDKGLLVRLDFTTLHERQCTGMNAPDSEVSDYEMYHPRGEGACLLGRQQSITRRKRDAACFNGVTFDRTQFVKNCPCEEEDFECDFGFQRAADKTCERVADAPPINRNAPTVCNGVYTVTRGYRRVPGDSCEGGIQDKRDPLEFPCPGISVVTVLLLFVLVGVAFTLAIFTYYKRSVDYYAMPAWLRWMDDTFSAVRYRRFDSQPDSMDEDDFDLGDEDTEAQVLGDTAILSYTSSKNNNSHHSHGHSSSSAAAPASLAAGGGGASATSRVNMDVKVPALRPPPRSRAGGEFGEDDFNPGD